MSKKKKILLSISGIIIIVVVALILTLNSISSSLVEKSVRNAIENKQIIKGYRLTFKKIGFNLLNGSVTIKEIKLKPGSSFVDSLKNTGFKEKYFDIEVGRISVSGIGIKKFLKSKSLNINKIKIKKPKIKIYEIKGKNKPAFALKNKKNNPVSSLSDSIRINQIKNLKINLIELLKCNVDIIDEKTKKPLITNDEIEILIKDVSFTESGNSNGYLYPHIANASLTIDNNYVKLPGGLYEITFKKFYANLKGNKIQVQDFHYKPLYSKKRFSKKIKWQKDRIDLFVREININDIDFEDLLFFDQLRIKRVYINNGTVDLYRDKNIPFNHDNRPLLPHQALKRSSFEMKIDTVYIHKMHFVYEELPEKSNKGRPIHFEIKDINGKIVNINSIKSELSKKSNLTVSVTGKLMGKALLSFNLTAPLTAKNDVFYYHAETIKPFNLKILNDAVFPAAGVKFESGIVEKLKLSATSYPTFAHGKFIMLYHDLKLSFLKDDEKSKKKTLTWGVNKLVAKNNPSKPGKKTRISVMFFERDMEKGFGNYLWKTIFSGMKSSVVPLIQNQTSKKFQKFLDERKNKRN